MRVLLDECVPRKLLEELAGHDASTVAEAGWSGIKNGQLLQLAASKFDVLLTVDRSLEYQQNFAGLVLAVVVMQTPSNDIAYLRPLIPQVLAALKTILPGQVVRVNARLT